MLMIMLWIVTGLQVVLIVGDASGTISGFDGKSGRSLWRQDNTHDGGLLAFAVHPDGKYFHLRGKMVRLFLGN